MDFDDVEAGAVDGRADHRRRRRARRRRDDGPAVPAGGRGLHPRRAARPTPAPSCSSRSSGCPHGVAADTERSRRSARRHGVRTVRVAADDVERALLWKGRKSAFGAIARIKPNYYLHDTVVPRGPAAGGAGQGLRDRRPPRPPRAERVPRRRRQPAPAARVRRPRARRAWTRVHAAGDEIVRASRRGRRRAVRRARHRPREARLHAAACSRPVDLAAQAALRDAFDPDGLANPGKVLPSPAAAATSTSPSGGGRGRMDLTCVRRRGRRRRTGHGRRVGRTRGGRGPRRAARWWPAGRDRLDPAGGDDRVVRRRHARRRARRRAGRAYGQRVACRRGHGRRRAGGRAQRHPPARLTARCATSLLQARYVSAAGEIVKARRADGEERERLRPVPAARRVAGTLGFLGDVILRTRPRARCEQWFRGPSTRATVAGLLYRPTSVLWDGTTTWVLLEGDEGDVDDQASRLALERRRAAGPLPTGGRWSMPPAGAGLAAGHASSPRSASAIVHHAEPSPPPAVDPTIASSCTAGSRSASTRPARLTPASTRSLRTADRPFVDAPPGPDDAVVAAAASPRRRWGCRRRAGALRR